MHAEPTEDVVDEALGERNVGVRCHAHWLEALVSELRDEAFDWHAVLQSNRDGSTKRVHQSADGRTFLRHRDEEFTWATVVVKTNDEVTLVACNVELVRH